MPPKSTPGCLFLMEYQFAAFFWLSDQGLLPWWQWVQTFGVFSPSESVEGFELTLRSLGFPSHKQKTNYACTEVP